jgi:HK97 family phage prohead protease
MALKLAPHPLSKMSSAPVLSNVIAPELKPAPAPRSSNCACSCESCVAGNCANCTNTECDDPECPCEQDTDSAKEAKLLAKIIAFQETRHAAVLAARGGTPNSAPTIRSAVTDDGILELFCYDDIGEGYWSEGITARSFRGKVESSPPFTSIRLRINSWGGDSFEGVTIGNYLKSLGKPIETVIDGIAASAASVIAMCGSTITMGPNTMMMVHNASTWCYGYASDMRQTADVLDAVSGAVAQTYVTRTGRTAEEIKTLLDAETWMDAKTCLEKGFCTKISETETAATPEPAPAATAKPVQSAHFPYRNVPAAAARPAMRASFKLRASSLTAELIQRMINPAEGSALDNLAGKTIELSAAESKAMFNSDTPVSLAVRNFSGSKDGARFKSQASGAGAATKVSMLVVPYDGVLSSNLGGYREVYEAGAFAAGLADDPRVTFLHDEGKILGRVSANTARFWEDAEGVHAECTPPEASWATDLLVSMQRKDIDGSSAAFWILKDRWEMRGNQKVRIVEKALMREAAVHSFPAYETTEAGVEPGQVESHGEVDFQQQLNENRLRLLALEIF